MPNLIFIYGINNSKENLLLDCEFILFQEKNIGAGFKIHYVCIFFLVLYTEVANVKII